MREIEENDLRNGEKMQSEHKQKCQEEYVMAVKNTLDCKLFANDFDTWIVSRQCDWINKNLQKLYPNVPESLLHLIPASFRQDNCGRSQMDKPAWLDLEKYRKGQKFVHDYYTSVSIIPIFSLLHTYIFNNTLKPIILNDNSHTPYLALKRYVSTMRRIQSWYDEEPWIKGTAAYNNMQFARRMHQMIRTKVSRLNNDEYDAVCTFANPWCPDRELLLKDFVAACPFEKSGQLPHKLFANSPYRQKAISHADIAMLQCAFAGMIVLHPDKWGMHYATDEELEAFCHMWRCYGYLLGIEDEYNFCRGSLEEIRQRTRDLNKYWIVPHLKYVTPEWEHMTRCMIESFNLIPFMYIPYKSAIIFDMDMLGVNMSYLYASLSYPEWAAYQSFKFVLRYVMRSSYIRMLFGKMMNYQFNQMINLSPEKEAEFHEKSKKQIEDFSITGTNY